MTDEIFDSKPAPGGKELLNWEDKARFRNMFTQQAVRSYLWLSLGMGVVAMLLPILVVAVGGYEGHYSISYFYYVLPPGATVRTCQNIFVGSLCATGVFLILYRGLSRWENWILNAAGVAAICVANFPMGEDQCSQTVTVHGIAATFFFLCLAVVAVGFSKDRIKYIIYPPYKRAFTMAYNVIGFLMIAMPLGVGYLYRNSGCDSHSVFWIEVCGIWAFALYWFVKTAEYKLLLGIRMAPPASLS